MTVNPVTSQNPVSIWIPVITAILTFILTSIFTVIREKRNTNVSKRIFFNYMEIEQQYPFVDKDTLAKRYGKGQVLFGENGSKLKNHARNEGTSLYTFMILRNVTNNDAINVKIKTKFSDSSKVVAEDFYLPSWTSDTSIYLPQSVYGSSSHLSTNESIVITYTTMNYEKFRFRFKRLCPYKKYMFWRSPKIKYKETLHKKYFGFVWIRNIKFQHSSFYSFETIGE